MACRKLTISERAIGTFAALVLAAISFMVPSAAWATDQDGADSPLAVASLTAQAGSTVDSATPVALNSTISGVIGEHGGQDWYKINLTAAGKFQIRFSGAYRDGGSWRVSLRDADNDEMWYTEVYARDCLASKTITLHTTGLKPGTYYICVTGWSINSLTYKLAPVFAASTAWEREWNDTVESPNSLTLNKTVNATSKTHGDEDWYKLVLPASGKFQIKFKAPYHDGGEWNISLLDANNNQVGDDYSYDGRTKAEKTVIVRTLKKGTYYIRVRGWSVNSVTYNLTPTYYVNNTKIISPVRAKKAITVKWKKVSGVVKYQIRYSLKKNMKGAKKVDASKKTTSKKIKGLKSKRIYYVQVRAVKKIGGVYYYSAWSAARAIKTK